MPVTDFSISDEYGENCYTTILGKDKNSNDYFRLAITTTEPCWPELKIEIFFDSPDDIYGFGGFEDDLENVSGTQERRPQRICHDLLMQGGVYYGIIQ